jgi:hypothetical protein
LLLLTSCFYKALQIKLFSSHRQTLNTTPSFSPVFTCTIQPHSGMVQENTSWSCEYSFFFVHSKIQIIQIASFLTLPVLLHCLHSLSACFIAANSLFSPIVCLIIIIVQLALPCKFLLCTTNIKRLVYSCYPSSILSFLIFSTNNIYLVCPPNPTIRSFFTAFKSFNS